MALLKKKNNANLSFQIIPTNDQLFSSVNSTECYQTVKNVDTKRYLRFSFSVQLFCFNLLHNLHFRCSCCTCNCHGDKSISINQGTNNFFRNNINNNNSTVSNIWSNQPQRSNNWTSGIDEGCQTLSTGDIVITKIYFKEDQEKGPEKVIVSSPKKIAQ